MQAPQGRRAPRALRICAAIIFFFSGISGLVYQAVWSQYLGLILGHAAYAQALVLAIFMGGMALGAWAASGLSKRIARPLLAYGYIEAAIGCAGLVFHAIFLSAQAWLYDQLLPGASSTALASSYRWSIAIALILPQSILLGTTFPLMSTALVRILPGTTGNTLGLLYFLNSAGAAVGALIATFYLVPKVGLPGAMSFAGWINIAILPVTMFFASPSTAVPLTAATGSAVPDSDVRIPQQLLLVAAGLTGFSSFMYEIGWVRMLSMVLGSSQHAFEIMLAAFIGGLALGGLWVRKRLDDGRNLVDFIGIIQIAMGVAALGTLLLYASSFAWVSWLTSALSRTDPGYIAFNFGSALIAIAIMLPAAFCAGMTLPAITALAMRQNRDEKRIGRIYSANTVGAILGVFFTVHFALPTLGLKLTMLLAGVIDIALGLYLIHTAATGSRGARRIILALTSLIVVAVVANFAQFDPRRMASGVFRHKSAELQPDEKVFFFRDGKTASISLHGVPDEYAIIATNGKPDASLTLNPSLGPTVDEPTMILAGLLPFAYHPEIKSVGIIGFGSGLTTHTVAGSSQPETIETVEIEPMMVAGARGYGFRVERAFTDPRSRIVIDDARAYFSGNQRKFDVIISEPSNPWVAGVAKLFSREFYKFVPRHLNPNGILVQWIQAYETDIEVMMSIFGALDEQFNDYAVFLSNDADMLVIAIPEGKLPPLSTRFLNEPRLKELAEFIGITNLGDLQARQIAGPREIRALLQTVTAPVNTDFYPFVANRAPRARYKGSSATEVLGVTTGPLGAFNLFNPPRERIADNAPHSDFLVPSRRRHGQQLAELLLELPATSAPPSIRMQARMFTQLREQCFTEMPTAVTVPLILETFEMTAIGSTPRDLREVWTNSKLQQCAEDSATEPALALLLRNLAAASTSECTNDATSIRELARQHRTVETQILALAIVSAINCKDNKQIQEVVHSSATLQAVARNYLGALARLGTTSSEQQKASYP